ncbi:carbohydrate ABC transporter permease [Bailinhaonella thermotolerans]|uniref:Carbohydrate ABC transporter permease n=1 Tax=Bailinhaonella thermotolerans TaxID=1070861 RepID=A0A3A4AW65_9ACTN|nr:carbohydrate ABC transporter permease [Bailinhaonella thermotolerans]RJL30093.1 carbohydrate ABC transporter permease [Bailinhaonella thermotolerans]
MTISKKRSPLRVAGLAIVWLIVAADIALLIWIFLTSLRDTKDIFARPFALPTSAELGNYANAWGEGGFGAAALSSVLLAVVSSIAAVAISAPAAYMLARRRTRTSNSITMLFAMGLGVPGQVLLVPLFVAMASVGLVDTYTGLNLIYIGLALPFTVYLLTGFFAGVPLVLEEAAAIDGASGVRAFVRVILPVARGGLITAFLLHFIGSWNETLFAIAFMQSDDKVTLPVALVNFVKMQQFNGLDWGTMFAGMCIILAPMVALFAWMGSRIIQGMTVGIGK